jgi:hypothetical protein
MRVRDGLSPITANMGNNNYQTPQGYKVGKVYAVMLSPSSVPKKIWEDNGGWGGIGTIIYQEYREDIEISLKDLTDEVLLTFNTALPFYPNQKYFPLPGEIVLLMDLPSAPSPITNKTNETYYQSPINAWNSPQFNGLFLHEDKEILYNSFIENGDFRGLQTFEGDYILEGRFGNSIRFGSTNKSGNEDLSPWSTNPIELASNPIILLSNQHNFKLPGSELNVEDINKDGSSIYLTSDQSIPLNIGNVALSSITNPINLADYTSPQVIINADRTVISSKSDEILMFGKTGIELYSQGPVYLQSANVGLTMQDNQIYLGPFSNNSTSPEPLVLGLQLQEWLSDLTVALSTFATVLGPTFSQAEGTLLESVNSAASALQDSVDKLNTRIVKETLISKVTYTT